MRDFIQEFRAIPTHRKVGYALAIYWLLGSGVDQCGTQLNPYTQFLGAACEKPYLPGCMKLNAHAFLGNRRTNSLGYIGAEIEIPKPARITRIACMGGSTSFLPIAGAYPDHLQEVLDRLRPGEFEVVNTSLPAYSLIEISTQLEREVPQIDADVVIVAEPWNFTGAKMGYRNLRGERGPVRQALGQLPLYGYVGKLVQLGREIPRVGDYAPSVAAIPAQVDAYMRTLNRIAHETRRQGRTLVLGILPDDWASVPDLERIASYDIPEGRVHILYPVERIAFKQAVNRAIREYAEEHQLPTIDWAEEFPPARSELFQSDGAHFTSEGALQLALIAAPVLLDLHQDNLRQLETSD